MISTDDPDDKRKTRRPDALFDPWAGWKPAWTTRHRGRRRKNAAPATPHDHQETHSPTEAVEMRLSAERTTTRSQRRIVDARNLCHAAVIDILCHGKSCRESDRARRVRNGWSRSNLLEALFVYCEMRGWPAR